MENVTLTCGCNFKVEYNESGEFELKEYLPCKIHTKLNTMVRPKQEK